MVAGDGSIVPSRSLTGLTLLDEGLVGDFGAVASADRLLGFHRVEDGVNLVELCGDAVIRRSRATSSGVADGRAWVEVGGTTSPALGGIGLNMP